MTLPAANVERLNRQIKLIYGAVNKAEPSRLLARWKKDGPDGEVIQAMRRAIRKIDGTMAVTTDALAAAFEAGLRSFTRNPRKTLEPVERREG